MSLRTQFLRCCEDIHAFLGAQLLNQYAERHEHGTSIRSVVAVHDQRTAGLGVIRQCLIYQLDETACHFRYFALHRWPAMILILLHDAALVSLRIQNAKLTTRVVRTALTMDVTNSYVIVVGFIIGPVAWTFTRAFV